jgi:hypothetical protein
MATPGFDINELKRRMQGATQSLKHELGGLRTGRAAASMLEPVQVDAYGSHMPLNQLASLSIPAMARAAVAAETDSLKLSGAHRTRKRRGAATPRVGTREPDAGCLLKRPTGPRRDARRRPAGRSRPLRVRSAGSRSGSRSRAYPRALRGTPPAVP